MHAATAFSRRARLSKNTLMIIISEINTWTQLAQHSIVHTRSKAYQCADCGRLFGQPASLAVHQQHMHQTIDWSIGKLNWWLFVWEYVTSASLIFSMCSTQLFTRIHRAMFVSSSDNERHSCKKTVLGFFRILPKPRFEDYIFWCGAVSSSLRHCQLLNYSEKRFLFLLLRHCALEGHSSFLQF